MRLIRRITSGVLVMLFLVVPPLAALAWIRTWRWPTAADTAAWLAQPLTGATLLAIVAWLAAVAWLLVAAMLVRRVIHRAGRRPWRLRRLPTPMQLTAGSLAGMSAISMPSAVVTQADTAAASTDTAEQSSAADPTQSPATHATTVAGIELPGGGWIPYPTAVAVSAVAALIWLHRREQYTPGPPRLGRHHSDPDLDPLPAAAVTITAAVTGDDPTPTEATPYPETQPHHRVLHDLPPGLVTLHGPGALAAARGLLTTVLLHAALHPAHTVRVSVTAHDLRELLTRDPLAASLPGLDIAPSPAPSRPARPVHLSIHRPARTTLGQPSAAQPRTACDDELVTTVIVGQQPPHTTGWLVQTDGTITTSHGATSHGATSHGATSHGATGHQAPARLCVLAAATALDLIDLVHHAARTATPPPAAPSPSSRPPSSPPPGRLTLLGGCHLHIHGAPVRLRRTASLPILAYLGVHPDGASTTELIRAVWPGHPPGTITKRLHTTLSDLRDQLRHTLDEPVLRRDERYLLNPDAIDTDLHHLRHAITHAATALTHQQREVALHAVTDSYGGDLAAGCAWPWLHNAREALRRDVIDAYLLLAGDADPTQAATIVQAATRIDPCNMALRQRAVAALHASGDHDGADTLDRSQPRTPPPT